MSATNGHVKSAEIPLTLEEMRAKTKELRVANRYRIEKTRAKQAEVMEMLWDSYTQGFTGGTDLWEPLMRQQTQNAPGVPPAQPSDRSGGRNWPFWANDTQLNQFRQASRIAVGGQNAYAAGLWKNLVNAIIGKGMTYKVGIRDSAKKKSSEETLEEVREAVQEWVTQWIARNNWSASSLPEKIDFDAEETSVLAPGSTKEREMCARTLRDGDGILRMWYNADGTVDVRFVDPTLVWGYPTGATLEADGWSFGIQNRIDRFGDEVHPDRERYVAYYIRKKEPFEQNEGGDDGEEVPAINIIQIKTPGTDTEEKHGIPLFFGDMLAALRRASSGQSTTSLTARVQASTAEYWKHTIGTKDQIASLQNPGTRQVQGPNNSTVETYVPIPGNVRRGPASQEPVALPTPQGPSLTAVWKADLQQVGASVSAPEAMISGDADTATYASMSEAGSTYVNAREADQEHFKEPYRRLVWRVVAWAVHCGQLPQEAMTAIDIDVQAPIIHKDNKQEMAQVMTAELAAKVTSPQMEMMKRGNDPKRVMADWKEYNEQQGEQGGNPLAAMGGEEGEQPPEEEGGEPVDPRDSPSGGAGKLKRSADVGESLRDLLEGFTGVITDKKGAKRHYVNGKQVKGEEDLAAHRKANPHDYGREIEVNGEGGHEEEAAERSKVHSLGSEHQILVLPGRGKTGGNQELMKDFDKDYASEIYNLAVPAVQKIADDFQIAMGDAFDALGTEDDKEEEFDKAHEQDAKAFRAVDMAAKLAHESLTAIYGDDFTPEMQAKLKEATDKVKLTIDEESGGLARAVEHAREEMPDRESDEFDAWKEETEDALSDLQVEMDDNIKSALSQYSDTIANTIVYTMDQSIEAKEEAIEEEASDALDDVRNSDSSEEDAAAYNEQFAKSGNPNRVYFDEEDDEWYFEDAEDLEDWPGKSKEGKNVKESKEPREPITLDDVAGMYADILYGLYGDKALKHLDVQEAKEPKAKFTGVITDKRNRKIYYAEGKRIKNPQTEAEKAAKAKGKETGKRAKKGSPEAVDAAKKAVGEVLSGKGSVTPDAMVGHLDSLTVAQLKGLHKEHGVKAPGKLRKQLVESIKQRMGQAKPEEPAKEATTEQNEPEKKKADASYGGFYEGSKAVDADGKPVMMYHGTNKDFDEFKEGTLQALGKGVYLTTDKDEADGYAHRFAKNPADAKVMDLHAVAKKPFHIDGELSKDELKELRDAASKTKGFDSKKFDAEIAKMGGKLRSGYVWSHLAESLPGNTAEVNDVLAKAGYDSVVMPSGNGHHWVLFDPKQVKSASNNNPDPHSTNINAEQMSGEKSATPIDELPKKSKNVSGKKKPAGDTKMIEPSDTPALANAIQGAGNNLKDRFGGGYSGGQKKVFISDLYDSVKGKFNGSFDDFKKAITLANKNGDLEATRLDMVSAVPQDMQHKIQESHTPARLWAGHRDDSEFGTGPQFHLVTIKEPKKSGGKPAGESEMDTEAKVKDLTGKIGDLYRQGKDLEAEKLMDERAALLGVEEVQPEKEPVTEPKAEAAPLSEPERKAYINRIMDWVPHGENKHKINKADVDSRIKQIESAPAAPKKVNDAVLDLIDRTPPSESASIEKIEKLAKEIDPSISNDQVLKMVRSGVESGRIIGGNWTTATNAMKRPDLVIPDGVNLLYYYRTGDKSKSAAEAEAAPKRTLKRSPKKKGK